MPPIDWDLITLPTVDNEHAMNNRLTAEQVAVVLPIVVEQYPFYAPMIFALYTLGLRYCHVAAMRWSKLGADGVIAIEESCDASANVFSAVDQRKKAPPMIALEPRTLELVRRHRRYLTQRSHPGLTTGLVFPSEAGTRPVGNDQLNDVWREVQVMAGRHRPPGDRAWHPTQLPRPRQAARCARCGGEGHGGPCRYGRRGARPGQAPALQPGRDGGGDAPGIDGAHATGPYRAHGSPKR